MNKSEFPELPNGLKVKELWQDYEGNYIALSKRGDVVYMFVWDKVSVTYNSVSSYIKIKK